MARWWDEPRCLGAASLVVLCLCGCDGPTSGGSDAISWDSGPAPTTSLACPDGPVGAKGVGKPCTSVLHCQGTQAPNCPVQFNPAYPDFCTLDAAKDKDCGSGAICRKISSGTDTDLQICVPKGPCAEKIGAPCSPVACSPDKQVNDTGLGKPCAAAADCKGLKADYCPVTLNPKGPRYCVLKCTCNDECGPGGLCVDVPEGTGCDPAACHPGEPGIACKP